MQKSASGTGESPWRQLRERAERFQGDKKHAQAFSRRALVKRSSIQHRVSRQFAVSRCTGLSKIAETAFAQMVKTDVLSERH